MIQYGTTLDYGSSSPANLAFTGAHIAAIAGLQAGTYAYRIESIDMNGHLAAYDGTFGTVGSCARDSRHACLLNGRFDVSVAFVSNSGSGNAQLMSFNSQRAETDESAFFWFFNPANFEMGIKMVDACVPLFGNKFWVFASG
ncbi:MAG TPA: hypothetical protein VGS57_10445 [Thermoanaerobaculia bacterium]|jgi:hypothetical protein|nr:hypothetical protein [Thermoanaerobaculia bacterium]